jgi:quercetin dioxygenase-like cupin family protein
MGESEAKHAAKLTPWPHEAPPSEQALDELLRAEGLQPRWWSNGPGDRYGGHSHPYHKVLYCARGSIRFTSERTGEHYELEPGDRLDLPPGTPHSAVVGTDGVTCVEAARA